MGNTCCGGSRPSHATTEPDSDSDEGVTRGTVTFEGKNIRLFKASYFECLPAGEDGRFPLTLTINTKGDNGHEFGILKGWVWSTEVLNDMHSVRAALAEIMFNKTFIFFCMCKENGEFEYFPVVTLFVSSDSGLLTTFEPRLVFEST